MKSIEAFILAGGLSRRMGRDKAQLEIGGITLIRRIAGALSAVTDKISIVGKSGYDLNLPLVKDIFPFDSAESRPYAAIIGLYSALVNANAEWIIVAACDLPFVSSELFEYLISRINAETKAVAPIQPDGTPQPLCAIYKREYCLKIVEKMLPEHNWSLRKLLQQTPITLINFDELAHLHGAENFFTNLNAPTDYEKAQNIICLEAKLTEEL